MQQTSFEYCFNVEFDTKVSLQQRLAQANHIFAQFQYIVQCNGKLSRKSYVNLRSKYSDKNLLMLGTGNRGRQAVLERIASYRFNKFVILNDDENWSSIYADDYIVADAIRVDQESTLAAIKQYQERHEIEFDAIYSYDDFSIQLTAKLAQQLGKVGNSYDAIATAKNKYLFRQFCQTHNLPFPKYCKVRTEKPDFSDALDSLEQNSIKFPIVVKPIFGAGSYFVRKIENEQEFLSTLHAFVENMKKDAVSSTCFLEDILGVEEYIDGEEVDIDVLVQDSQIKFICITDNFPSRLPFFMEVGGQIPSSLVPDYGQDALIKMVYDVLAKIGVTNSCIHFEAKHTALGPVPIEINMRIGGAEVYKFVEHCYGVDLVDESINIVFGERVDVYTPPKPIKYMTSINFIPHTSGRIKSQWVDRKLFTEPWFVQMVLLRDVNELMLLPPRGYKYLGWAITSGKDPEESKKHMAELVSRTKFEFIECY